MSTNQFALDPIALILIYDSDYEQKQADCHKHLAKQRGCAMRSCRQIVSHRKKQDGPADAKDGNKPRAQGYIAKYGNAVRTPYNPRYTQH